MAIYGSSAPSPRALALEGFELGSVTWPWSWVLSKPRPLFEERDGAQRAHRPLHDGASVGALSRSLRAPSAVPRPRARPALTCPLAPREPAPSAGSVSFVPSSVSDLAPAERGITILGLLVAAYVVRYEHLGSSSERAECSFSILSHRTLTKSSENDGTVICISWLGGGCTVTPVS